MGDMRGGVVEDLILLGPRKQLVAVNHLRSRTMAWDAAKQSLDRLPPGSIQPGGGRMGLHMEEWTGTQKFNRGMMDEESTLARVWSHMCAVSVILPVQCSRWARCEACPTKPCRGQAALRAGQDRGSSAGQGRWSPLRQVARGTGIAAAGVPGVGSACPLGRKEEQRSERCGE
jgi:hypothetical protein